MKRIIQALAILCFGIQSANATGIKLYIGTAVYEEKQTTRFFLQLIVCNNLSDTIYIKRDDLDNVYPRVTTDVSEINDGGTYYLLNNITNLLTDRDELIKLSGGAPQERFENTLNKQRNLYEENNKLQQTELNGIKYYIFAPNKCITINAVTQTPVIEFLKLHNVNEQQQQQAETYLTTLISYFTYHDKTMRRELLISRSSEELKKCIFINNKKK